MLGKAAGTEHKARKAGARQGEADADTPVPGWARTGMLPVEYMPFTFLTPGLKHFHHLLKMAGFAFLVEECG